MKRFKINKGFQLRYNGTVYPELSEVSLPDKDSSYFVKCGLLSEMEEAKKVDKSAEKKPPVKEEVKPKKKTVAKKATTKKKTAKKEK
jgi:hypothetical protein